MLIDAWETSRRSIFGESYYSAGRGKLDSWLHVCRIHWRRKRRVPFHLYRTVEQQIHVDPG